MTTSRSLRVLHVLTSDHRRGAEVAATDLSRRLASLGHWSTVVALAASSTNNPLDVRVLGGERRLGLKALQALRREARSVDVVVAHGSATLPACALALLGFGFPPFVYVNIGDPLYWARDWRRRLRVRLMLSRASAVAALSPSSREVLEKSFGVPAARSTVIANGRDVDAFLPCDEHGRGAARASLGLPVGSPVVLVIAALSPEKRLDVAVEAVATVDGAHLVLVGAGPQAGALAALCERRLPGRAHLVGQQSDVHPYLATADLLLLTSASEGLPGVLVEAALSGLPAVATDVGFIRDIVKDGVTGLLVDAGDVPGTATALRKVLHERIRMGSAARAHAAQHFNAEELSLEWERFLLDVVGAPGLLKE